MLIRLEVEAGPDAGMFFDIVRPGVFVIGRSPTCDYALPRDPYVARAQLMIKASLDARTCEVRHVRNARNPCYIDGEYAVSGPLRDGASLEIGYSRLRVRMDWERVVAFQHCCDCAAEVYLLPGETHSVERVRCEGCRNKAAMALANPIAAASPSIVPEYRCCHCDADISKTANGDGRAFELRGAVEYSCAACADRDSRDDASSGQQIGPWQVLREIGRGGMGAVTLVRHRGTGRLAAMKVAGLAASRARFSREMRLLKTFRHPNIVRYIEHFDEPAESYLVMQYVRGSDLEDVLLNQGRPLDWREAFAVGRAMLSALAYMHKHNEGEFVHRDLKPENVLIAHGSADSRPLLTDFGLAKNRKGRTRMTRFGVIMGTWAYAPRELLRDAASAGPQADVYAMGVVLYYLISGKYPFPYPSPLEALERARREGLGVSTPASLAEIQHRMLEERGFRGGLFDAAWKCQMDDSQQPIPLLERAAQTGIPPELTAVVDRAIQKAPERRFEDARQMLAAVVEATTKAA